DASAKRQLARLTGKDAWAGKQSARLDGRARRAENGRAEVRVKKQYEMGFWVHVGERSQRNRVLSAAAGELALGTTRRLVYPDLSLGPADRVALVGANGLGKSTLVRHLLRQTNVPPERLVYVPQEISAAESRQILAAVSELSREELGKVMTSVSRLGSRPGRLIESAQPSPGEIRKILLALGVVRGPHLIVMDEPTNHMDLPSITCVEEALEDCPCALLLVSHDLRFLDALVEWRWQLEMAEDDQVRLRVTPWKK
ncbi:MAG: ATP-binding cassette domain-containing protein, partial [Kiritimatiellae bacterium]|nr:ATP-binding cassette domain-containing protein [Kiritimatiellia bacterium]